MKKQKSNSNIKTRMSWIVLVTIILIVMLASTTIYVISCTNFENTPANANADNSLDIQEENVLSQEELVDTSNMSEEELKKLNKEEQKKLEEKNKKENKTTEKKKNKYYIKVNYRAQVVTVYTYDKNGKYTVPVRACVCSTGAATPPSGVYNIGYKWVWGKLYGNVWGHYTSQIVGDILFHSVPYMKAKNDTLVSTYYDRLGRKDSMGCVRLTTIDAKWIFENCPSGTQVEFYSSSNPGPLGKPIATKVSNAPGKLKNWDPTDPDSQNPWKSYKPESNLDDEKNNEKTDEDDPTTPVTPTKPDTEVQEPNNPETEKPENPDKPETDKPENSDKPETEKPENPDEPKIDKPEDSNNPEVVDKPENPEVDEKEI